MAKPRKIATQAAFCGASDQVLGGKALKELEQLTKQNLYVTMTVYYIYIHIYICHIIYIHTYIHTYIYIYMYSVYIHIYIHIYTIIYIYGINSSLCFSVAMFTPYQATSTQIPGAGVVTSAWTASLMSWQSRTSAGEGTFLMLKNVWIWIIWMSFYMSIQFYTDIWETQYYIGDFFGTVIVPTKCTNVWAILCFLALTVCVTARNGPMDFSTIPSGPSAWSQGARCSVAAAHILGPRPPVKSPQHPKIRSYPAWLWHVMTFTVRHGKSPF